jgi:hypothetical protein
VITTMTVAAVAARGGGGGRDEGGETSVTIIKSTGGVLSPLLSSPLNNQSDTFGRVVGDG